LGSTLTASPWNGATGGILAIDIRDQLDLNFATVSVDGLGFRAGGGQQLTGSSGANTDYRTRVGTNTNGNKGEGIAGTPIAVFNGSGIVNTGSGYPTGTNRDGDRGRGAPGNAGGGGTDGHCENGNDENTGGAGGMGGRSWNTGFTSGGLGGSAVAGLGAARVVLGGGGGAGTNNNNPGQSSGTCGGGIIMIRTATVTGYGTLTANGASPVNTTSNDGGGGGGAGGSIVLTALEGTWANARVYAMGGRGEDSYSTSAPAGAPPVSAAPGSARNPAGAEHHGPGGGGGGGVIILSSPALATDVSGGGPGITTTSKIPFSAQAGKAGVVVTNALPSDIPGCQSGAETHRYDGNHLVFQSAPLWITPSSNAQSVVMARTITGEPYNVASNTTLALSSTSGTTTFYTDATYTTTTTSVIMAAGTSSVTIYWRETSDGTPTITATRTAGDLAPVGNPPRPSSASQIQRVYGSVSKFVLQAPPSAAVNSAFALTVAAVDANNSINPDYSGTISFSATGSGNTLPPDYTFVPAADQGIHAFPAGSWTILGTPGSQTVTVAQGANTGSATVYVYPSVAITSASSVIFTIGIPGTFTITTAATPAYTASPAPVLTVQGALPSGVTFIDNGDGTARISGTPTVAGSFPLVIRATYGPSQFDAVQNPFMLIINDPLAVSLSFFTCSVYDGAVNLTWRTESEHDCLRWEIERSEAPDDGYRVIGSVPGHGNTNHPHDYAYLDNSLNQAGSYYYRLSEISLSGTWTYYGPVLAVYAGLGITSFQAGQAYPNPLRNRTSINFQLPRAAETRLYIFNVIGQVVNRLEMGTLPAGRHTIVWDATGTRPGVYYYRLTAGEHRALGKVTVVR
jgi:hypothetical protein